MKKLLIWIISFVIVQAIVLFVVGFTLVPVEIKRIICIAFIIIELCVIFYTDTTINRKHPHKALPDDRYVNEIISELNLGSILTADDVLKEHDTYKSFSTKKRSNIAKAFVPNKYFTSKKEYKIYVNLIEWEVFIIQLALYRMVDSDSLFRENKTVFIELVRKVYGYSFYNELDLSFLESIKQISDNSIFAYNLYEHLNKCFFDYIRYCVFMKNNATKDGLIIWANLYKKRISEIYQPALSPALENTYQCSETDTIYFPCVKESEAIDYFDGRINIRECFDKMNLGE